MLRHGDTTQWRANRSTQLKSEPASLTAMLVLHRPRQVLRSKQSVRTNETKTHAKNKNKNQKNRYRQGHMREACESRKVWCSSSPSRRFKTKCTFFTPYCFETETKRLLFVDVQKRDNTLVRVCQGLTGILQRKCKAHDAQSKLNRRNTSPSPKKHVFFRPMPWKSTSHMLQGIVGGQMLDEQIRQDMEGMISSNVYFMEAQDRTKIETETETKTETETETEIETKTKTKTKTKAWDGSMEKQRSHKKRKHTEEPTEQETHEVQKQNFKTWHKRTKTIKTVCSASKLVLRHLEEKSWIPVATQLAVGCSSVPLATMVDLVWYDVLQDILWIIELKLMNKNECYTNRLTPPFENYSHTLMQRHRIQLGCTWWLFNHCFAGGCFVSDETEPVGGGLRKIQKTKGLLVCVSGSGSELLSEELGSDMETSCATWMKSMCHCLTNT